MESCAVDLWLVVGSLMIEMVSRTPPKLSKDLYCSGAGAIEQLQDTSSFIWYILLAWVFLDSVRFVVFDFLLLLSLSTVIAVMLCRLPGLLGGVPVSSWK